HEHDPAVARADAPGGLDVELALRVEDRAPDHPREAGDPADTDRAHDLLEAGSEDGDDDESQKDAGEGELHVDDTHENPVGPLAGGCPHRYAALEQPPQDRSRGQ